MNAVCKPGIHPGHLVMTLWIILCSACNAERAPSPTLRASQTVRPLEASPTLIISLTPTETPTPNPVINATKTPMGLLWIAPYLPQAFQKTGQSIGINLTGDRKQAQLVIEAGDQAPIGYWVFALAAPFPTLLDGLSGEAARQAWAGDAPSPFSGKPILVSPNTLEMLSAWWGEPGQNAIQVLPEGEIEGYAWDHRPSLAILPFEALTPRWKVLEIEGQSPLRKIFDLSSYALSLPISLNNSEELPTAFEGPGGVWITNWDANRLTTVILTGVTALVRGTALAMESRGAIYPGEDIAPWLRQADFTHINNEVPFYDQCPYPELYPAELRFCSAPKYIGLLEDIGADIIELTGDHFSDYGSEALLQTLAMYQERGWSYYGGGENTEKARQPILIDHHNNRLAILGCNAKGTAYYAQASESTPGAVACDFDWLTAEITRLREEGYLVIVTFQDVEYYSYTAQPKLIQGFRRATEAGAVIVSGSQAHQPHGMEFINGSFIHYGLGNLFFDQYRYLPGGELDRAFIDRHVFYDGRYIGTELLTIQFIDLARSRPTTREEREQFLKIIFTASGW